MKKIIAVLLALLVISTMLGMTAFAANKTVQYYDENGNSIVVNGMYYNNQGEPMYNAACYYLDENGNSVYVGGCRAYCYDANGNLIEVPGVTFPMNNGGYGGGCCQGRR